MLLIDAYNLFHQTTFEHREELINAIDAYCRARHKTALMVFDGWSPNDLSTNLVQVRFAGDADLELCGIMQAADSPSKYTLVSDDREILHAARKHKVSFIKASDFNFSVPEELSVEFDEDPNLKVSGAEVQELLNEFKNK